MAVKNLTDEQREFILSNAKTMKQKEIADMLGITPSCVNQNLKKVERLKDGFFDVDSFQKYYRV